MKVRFNQNLADKILFYSLSYLAVVLPFQLVWISPTWGIIGCVLAFLIGGNFTYKWKAFKNNKALVLIISLYLLSLVGMLYTTNTHEGWKDVVMKLPLALIPLGFLGSHTTHKKRKHLLLLFIIACCTAVFLLFGYAFLQYVKDGHINHFSYHNFSVLKRVPIHYFALYCNFALFASLYYIFSEKERIKQNEKIIFSITIPIMLIALIFTAVRIQFIGLILMAILFTLWLIFKKKTQKKGLIFLVIILSFFVLLVENVPDAERRIKDTYNEWLAFKGTHANHYHQTNHRVYLWDYGLDVIAENKWIGTGTGSADDALYAKSKNSDALFWDGTTDYRLGDKQYNFHNELLQHWATYGLFLGSLLLILFLYSIYHVFKHKNFLGFCFLILTGIAFTTESMLERQAGNLFFAFFFAVLIIQSKSTKKV